MALATGVCANVGAFDASAPAALLVAPVVALALSKTRSGRLGVSILAHMVLWAPLPGMAVAYGLSPLEAWLGLSVIMLSQSLIVGLLPPALGVGLWALSPFGFGHPIFGIFSVMPFSVFGPVAGLAAAVLILIGLSIRRSLAPALFCLSVLGAISSLNPHAQMSSALVPVSTAFAERSMFPADDWAQIGAKLEGMDSSGTRLLPEGTIGQDVDRGYRFFSDVAGSHGHDLLVGVSDEDGEKIAIFFKDGRIEAAYQQVQGVPLINDRLAMPWHFFVGKAAPFDNERVIFAICFEAFLPLTWVRVLASRSTTVAVVSNDRWNSSSVRIAQAKLLSFPWPAAIVAAANSPEM